MRPTSASATTSVRSTRMLRLAIPEASVQATPMNNLVLLTGASRFDRRRRRAQRLVQAYVGTDPQWLAAFVRPRRCRSTSRFASREVDRRPAQAGSRRPSHPDTTSGSSSVSARATRDDLPRVVARSRLAMSDPRSALPGSCSGHDILSTLDLAETDGLVTTLAEPNLTALSSKTASFLAGREFPVPISQSLGSISIEYSSTVSVSPSRSSLPTAISMPVRPEVRGFSNEGQRRDR